MAKVWWLTSQKGFSPVEVLLAITIFGFMVVALIGGMVYGRQSTDEAGHRARAVMLAEEGLEATRNIRDANYANLANGTYGLVQSGNTWTLSGTSDIAGIYTRQVTIASNGTDRKQVSSTVTWPRSSGTSSVTVRTQLTNWMSAIAKSWLLPSVAGGADANGTANAIKVATQGNFAYVVRNDATPDFLIYNIATPTAPVLVGSLSLSGAPTNIAVSGNYAYVTTTDDAAELRIINVTNPAVPSVAGTYNAAGAANGQGVFVTGGYAYVVRAANGGSDEMVVVNVNNPTIPTRAGGYSQNTSMNEVYVNGNAIFIVTASDTQEVIQLNYTLLSLITFTAALNLPGTADATTITGTGNILFVGQSTNFYTAYNGNWGQLTGFNALDSLAISGTVADITLHTSNNLAFIGTSDGTKEFQVIDTTDITNISLVGTADQVGSNILGGVAYNSTLDVVAGASSSDTQEEVNFVPN